MATLHDNQSVESDFKTLLDCIIHENNQGRKERALLLQQQELDHKEKLDAYLKSSEYRLLYSAVTIHILQLARQDEKARKIEIRQLTDVFNVGETIPNVPVHPRSPSAKYRLFMMIGEVLALKLNENQGIWASFEKGVLSVYWD